MTSWYKEDLAFIHDAGFRSFALESAPGILEIFRRAGIDEGLVVDLGCGSGLWANELSKAHYNVLGIDLSESMIAIARKRVPDGDFRVGSLFTVRIPRCNAVTSLGECVNYLFDSRNNASILHRLFGRVYAALAPGGVFVFDIAGPGQVNPESPKRTFTTGEDWAVLVEKEEDRARSLLTRRITTFRKVGSYYRRDGEVHRVKLYRSSEVAKQLRDVGFRVRTIRKFGAHPLRRGNTAFIARKP